jgi:hypothetical protein
MLEDGGFTVKVKVAQLEKVQSFEYFFRHL